MDDSQGKLAASVVTDVEFDDAVQLAMDLVIEGARNGVIALCASVARLIQSKQKVDMEVISLQHEVASLQQIIATHGSILPKNDSLNKHDHLQKNCSFKRSSLRRSFLRQCGGSVVINKVMPCQNQESELKQEMLNALFSADYLESNDASMIPREDAQHLDRKSVHVLSCTLANFLQETDSSIEEEMEGILLDETEFQRILGCKCDLCVDVDNEEPFHSLMSESGLLLPPGTIVLLTDDRVGEVLYVGHEKFCPDFAQKNITIGVIVKLWNLNANEVFVALNEIVCQLDDTDLDFEEVDDSSLGSELSQTDTSFSVSENKFSFDALPKDAETETCDDGFRYNLPLFNERHFGGNSNVNEIMFENEMVSFRCRTRSLDEMQHFSKEMLSSQIKMSHSDNQLKEMIFDASITKTFVSDLDEKVYLSNEEFCGTVDSGICDNLNESEQNLDGNWL